MEKELGGKEGGLFQKLLYLDELEFKSANQFPLKFFLINSFVQHLTY